MVFSPPQVAREAAIGRAVKAQLFERAQEPGTDDADQGGDYERDQLVFDRIEAMSQRFTPPKD